MSAVTHVLTVIRTDGEQVICSGAFATADGKGTHSLLTPALHVDHIVHDGEIKVGDAILRHANGGHTSSRSG